MNAFEALNNINEYSVPKENDVKIYAILAESGSVLKETITDAIVYKKAFEYLSGFIGKGYVEACLNDAIKEVEK